MVKIFNLTLESGEISQPTWATEGEFVSPIRGVKPHSGVKRIVVSNHIVVSNRLSHNVVYKTTESQCSI